MGHAQRIGIVCIAALACIHVAAHASDKKLLTVDDLYRLEAPASGCLSQDGHRLAYARQWIDNATRQERSSLWLTEASRDRCRPLEPGEPDARSPVFSPDGKWIVFLSTRPLPAGWKPAPKAPAASDPATQVWIISAEGGSAIPLAGPERPFGRVFNDGFYGRLAFSPDGRQLVFVADDGACTAPAGKPLVLGADQGEGYTGYRPAQIWIAHLDSAFAVDPKAIATRKAAAVRVDRLTNDDIWYGDPQWSPDGRTIVVHANRTVDREAVRWSINKNFDLWAIDTETRSMRQLTTGCGPEVSPRFSPDGKRLACLSVPRQGSHHDVFNLAIVHACGDSPQHRVLFDHHGSGADRPAHPAPAFPLPDDCWDDDTTFYYNGESGTGGGLVRVDVSTGRGQFLMPFAGGPTGTPRNVLQRAMARHQLTPRANPFLVERTLGSSKVVRWKSEDWTIEGILTVPPEQAGKAPYKLVIYPHGGPHGRSVLGFDFTVQVFAAAGYAVLQPNYRGSTGYGQKFIDADRRDFGGGDMRDILAGIDHLVAEKIVDPSRLFIYGNSYGGFMASWMVGQTNRFRAAVAQNPVTDLHMMWALTDVHSWTQWEFGGLPWEVPDLMRKHSPLTYVAKVQTPTLILHARDDRRCPLPMGKAYYESLRARDIPTELVIYPDEGHIIRQPQHREDVLRRVLAWFDRFDKKAKLTRAN